MADSMKCLVGLAGTSLANRRVGDAQTVSSGSIAESGRLATEPHSASVGSLRRRHPGSAGEDGRDRPKVKMRLAPIRPGF
jgi:hypothetical protein